MQYSHIVWDFNGTILDDLMPCIEVLNGLTERRGLRHIEKDEYLEVFGFPIKAYYEKVGFDFTKEDYGLLADEWSLLYEEASQGSGLCDSVIKSLEYFKALGLPQYILSATEYGMLKKQVAQLGICGYFTKLLALKDFHAASKVALGIAWAAEEKPGRVLFIGDTVHDYETATAMGADCVLVAAGHQSKGRLLRCGVPVLDSLAELVPFFEKHNI